MFENKRVQTWRSLDATVISQIIVRLTSGDTILCAIHIEIGRGTETETETETEIAGILLDERVIN